MKKRNYTLTTALTAALCCLICLLNGCTRDNDIALPLLLLPFQDSYKTQIVLPSLRLYISFSFIRTPTSSPFLTNILVVYYQHQ